MIWYKNIPPRRSLLPLIFRPIRRIRRRNNSLSSLPLKFRMPRFSPSFLILNYTIPPLLHHKNGPNRFPSDILFPPDFLQRGRNIRRVLKEPRNTSGTPSLVSELRTTHNISNFHHFSQKSGSTFLGICLTHFYPLSPKRTELYTFVRSYRANEQVCDCRLRSKLPSVDIRSEQNLELYSTKITKTL